MVRGGAKVRECCDRYSGSDFYSHPGTLWPKEVQRSTGRINAKEEEWELRGRNG